jgi:hypothetical protein
VSYARAATFHGKAGDPLIPSALGFIFDDEGRTEQEKRELRHMSGDLITFTERRMYESYLLHPDAIASVMNDIEGFRSTPVQFSEIETWFNANQSRFGNVPLGEPWQNHVDAGKMLKALFNDLSETRVGYLKTRHSVAITEWLIEHRAETVEGLADEIEAVLDRGTAKITA